MSENTPRPFPHKKIQQPKFRLSPKISQILWKIQAEIYRNIQLDRITQIHLKYVFNQIHQQDRYEEILQQVLYKIYEWIKDVDIQVRYIEAIKDTMRHFYPKSLSLETFYMMVEVNDVTLKIAVCNLDKFSEIDIDALLDEFESIVETPACKTYRPIQIWSRILPYMNEDQMQRWNTLYPKFHHAFS